MATSIRPAPKPCRICGKTPALFGITRREKNHIVWIAVCGECKEESFENIH